MRLFLAAWLTVAATAFDAVLFSNEQSVSGDVSELLTGASAEHPMIFLVNPDFTLGQFSREASVYSPEKTLEGIAAFAQKSKNKAATFIENGLSVSVEAVTSADQFKTGSAVYVLAGEDWNSLDALAGKVLSQLSDYTAVITSTEAVSQQNTRVKRVSNDMMEENTGAQLADAANGPMYDMPLILPPYNQSGGPTMGTPGLGSCLLYMEGVNIIVYNKAAKTKKFATIPVRVNNTQWSYQSGDVSCPNGTVGVYSFNVRLSITTDVMSVSETNVKLPANTQLNYNMTFTGGTLGYWQISGISIQAPFAVVGDGSFLSGTVNVAQTTGGANQTNVRYMGLNSVQGWSVACSSSQAAFFKTDKDDVLVGISVYNTQVQTYMAINAKTHQPVFTLQVDDCVGTFSPGSWMGILSTLVMLSGLIFGYLMLQSVQTMDRFDDPKRKQIIINVRE